MHDDREQGMTARRLGNGTLRLPSLSHHGNLIEYEPAPYKTTAS